MNEKITERKLRRLFPNHPESFFQRNSDNIDTGWVHPDNQESLEGNTLVRVVSREAEIRNRFKIVFKVYATRPADWDAYSIKELQDLVVKSGIIPNDDWTTLSGEIIPKKAHKKCQERTEITIQIL